MKALKAFARLNITNLHHVPARYIATFLTVFLLCCVLSISINLRLEVQDNLQLLEQEFDVVVIPTFRGSIDISGDLAFEAKDVRTNKPIYAKKFDLSLLQNAVGAKEVQVNRQFGATVNNEEDLWPGNGIDRNTYDIIIFTYTGEEPAVLGNPWETHSEYLVTMETFQLDWSARGWHEWEFFATQSNGVLKYLFNAKADINWRSLRNTKHDAVFASEEMLKMYPRVADIIRSETVVLMPGQQYIASVQWDLYSPGDGDKYNYASELASVLFDEDQGHLPREYNPLEQGKATHMHDAYEIYFPPIMPYDEGFWETEAGKWFADSVEVCRINGKTLTAVATPDVSLYAPFYNDGVHIAEGRQFTEEEYETGSKVCLVSEYVAYNNGWEIGDKLDLSFYDAYYGFSGYVSDQMSYYEPLVQVFDEATGEYVIENQSRFFDEGGLYEIVGFYSGKVKLGIAESEVNYKMNEGIDSRVVIVPEKSVQNLPDVPLSQYNTTILLDDEQILYFMADMEASGLLEQQLGQYQVSFEIYDQGLGQIKQSLRQLDTVSKLTLYLACAAVVAVVILLSVLTVIQNRRQIATLRSIGVRKHQIPAAVLSGVLLVCLLGACLGGFIGYKASDKVAGYILETAQQDMADISFSAMLAGDTEAKEEAYTIAIQSHPQAAVFAAAAVMLSLTVLSCTLTLIEARKSPMLTLGAKE